MTVVKNSITQHIAYFTGAATEIWKKKCVTLVLTDIKKKEVYFLFDRNSYHLETFSFLTLKIILKVEFLVWE